jgi:hypothetical protein
MKIPHKVRIKARVSYSVLYADVIDDDPSCMGRAYPDGRRIVLKNGMSNSNLISTFIHELLHAIEYEYSAGIPHKVVDVFEKGIFKVLKLNKII